MHLEVRGEKCTGCRLCQQICAITHFNQINPKKSSIRVRPDPSRPGAFCPIVCTQCGECEDACLTGAISRKGEAYAIDAGECTFCVSCVEVCKEGVLRIHTDEEKPIMCDLCLKCVEICHSGALSAAG